MPTQKKFLDQDGLIQLLQEIESLDETNIKDVYWSTDNADTYPTIVFKVGDDNGSAHTIKKFTFKGDITSPAPSNTTTRSITLTIGGVDKTISYYDTTASNGITYTNATDSNAPASATNVKTALDRVITKLAGIVTDLNTVATGKGADMVAYSSGNSVKDALDDIYSQIGSGGGGNSLTSRVEALEDDVEDLQEGSNLVEGSNITITPNTTNHTVTIAAADEKVKQSPTTQEKSFRILLTGDEYTSATTAGANFSTSLKFNPNNKKMYLDSSYSTGSGGQAGVNYKTEIVVGGEGVQIIKKDGLNETLATGTLSATDYSGTAAKATADGSGNNIVNTYATKAALEALTNQLTGSFQIVSTLPTADGTHGGIIYLIKDQEYGDTNNNIFKEYVEVNDGTTANPSWKFELLGTTDAGVDVVSIPATGSNSVASMFAQYVLNV